MSFNRERREGKQAAPEVEEAWGGDALRRVVSGGDDDDDDDDDDDCAFSPDKA